MKSKSLADTYSCVRMGTKAGMDEKLQDCVQRMSRGDQQALGELYDATSRRVFALAYRMMGNSAAAEEVVSDVFFQAWRSAGTFDPQRAGVETWLLVVCRSRALDALRTRGDPASGRNVPDLVAERVSEELAPDGHLDARQRCASLRACLGDLAPLQRQLIALAFYRGYSHAEIASAMNLPLGSVKSHIRKALSSMREALAVTITRTNEPISPPHHPR